VSMSMVMRCAKKLRFNTAFGDILTAAYIEAAFVDFLAVCEVLLGICLLRLLLHGSRRPGSLIPLRFCSLHHFALPVHSPSGQPSVHSVLPRACRKER
jgi:hypothetical protein